MARRKRSPEVARPTGRRRLIELGKDALIVLLTCSAILLAGQTPMASQLRGMVAEPTSTAEPVLRSSREAVVPFAMTVRNELGLYGVSYDEALVDRTFQQLSSLLGEGLATAESVEIITRRQWQTMLERPGIYCAFQGSPPLSVLSAWLGTEEGGLSGGGESLLLAWDGQQVWLCWRDGNAYRRSRTQVAYEDHLETALEEFSPNGAAFAYALAAGDETYAALDGDVLVQVTTPQPAVYHASSPDFVGDGSALEQLLSALGFQSGISSAYETLGDLAINENGDRLRVNSAGRVTFYAGEESRYPVASAGERATAQEAAVCAWDLLNRVAAPWKGEGGFVLTGVRETAEGWRVTFHARLAGTPVSAGDEGWCAQFDVDGARITDFTLTLRTYTAEEATAVLPGERLAAAALRSLPRAGGRLRLRYSDAGGEQVSAGWVAEESK